MTEPDGKADLRRYLQEAREALLWKLDGLSEYDIRRPLVPAGTSLLTGTLVMPISSASSSTGRRSLIVAGCAASSPTGPAGPWWPPTRP
ncbi:MAG TPA: DUF664 domain-containing protein [Streptosporangiaceae bacterium]|nr:DUF664 domain-containing protein [Streptosporangiaceae bacterium]